MRVILAQILAASLAFQAAGAVRAVIPNGAAPVGSLSVINPSTGSVERSIVTAAGAAAIDNTSFAILPVSHSAAVLAISANAWLLSVTDLTTGKITAQQPLSSPLPPTPVSIAANPTTNSLYLTYSGAAHNTHIQQRDPLTLAVLRDANLGANVGLSMTVSPDGQSIYLTGNTSTQLVALKASRLTVIGTLPVSTAWAAVVSPDSATLYVAAGQYPNDAMSYIDTATLAVTETVPLSSMSVIFGLAISADGSQLYIPAQANFQGTDIFTLNIAAQTLQSVSVVVAGNVVASPSGTVYVGDGSDVVVFDPASQSVKATFRSLGSGPLALNSAGAALYMLNEFSSSLAETGPPPDPSPAPHTTP